MAENQVSKEIKDKVELLEATVASMSIKMIELDAELKKKADKVISVG